MSALAWDAATMQSETLPAPVLHETRGAVALRYWLHVPEQRAPHAPLLVAVHGVRRQARSLYETLAREADAAGAVLAVPIFDDARFSDYQRLGRRGRGERADLALLDLMDDVARRAPVTADRIRLLGFSGGAQFAHRFVMAWPERVAAALAVAAGWYTWPDPERRYPWGVRRGRGLPGVRLDPDRFLRVPLRVAVGDRDTQRGPHLRSSPKLDRWQGRTRLDRARRFVGAMQDAALARGLGLAPVTLRLLEGVDHSFGRSVSAGLDAQIRSFLLAPPEAFAAPLPAAARTHQEACS